MKVARKDIILHTIQKHNILPITSACNTSCIFCSHRFNPADLDVYKLPFLSLDDIHDMVSFLNPGRKIIIGESATRIVEGEPFVRKDILDILAIIREYFKEEIIEITTNGTGLIRDVVEKLKAFNPIELNISLNSANEDCRGYLQGDKNPKMAIEGVRFLAENDIVFHGSIVAMPMEVGYEDIYNTISYLDKNNCRTIRVLTPGFADSSTIKFDYFQLRRDLNSFINQIQEEIQAPILLEPPIIDELKPVIQGVIKDSPAYKKGLRRGDIIAEVNGQRMKTRVDCFNNVFKSANPKLKIIREESKGKEVYTITLDKEKNTSSGFIMLYDISTNVREDILSSIRRNRSARPLILVSELGKNIMEMLLCKEIESNIIKIKSVGNKLFGGSIKSAGLLVIEDFIDSINEVKEAYKPDLIILPSKAFDYRGRDLMGRSILDLENWIKIKVEVI